LLSILFVDLANASAGDVVRGDLALQIQSDESRLTGHIGNGVEHVPAYFAPIDELDPRNSDPFVEDLRGAWRVAAGRHGPDVRHVDECGTPRDQLLLVVERGDHIDGWLVGGG